MRNRSLGVLVSAAPELPNKIDVTVGWLINAMEEEGRLFGVFRPAKMAEEPTPLSEQEFVLIDPLFGAAAVKSKYQLPEDSTGLVGTFCVASLEDSETLKRLNVRLPLSSSKEF